MRIIIEKDYESMSQKAALLTAGQIALKPDSILGLATGGTPLGMYKNLIKMYHKNKIDFSKIKTFNLDEYCGLDPQDPNSYHYYMYHNFFNKINIKEKNIHIPNGKAKNFKKECSSYEQKIVESSGIDLQVLGIGNNGHIGFNEPAENLNAVTGVVNLTPETITANSRFFASQAKVPQKAISMGMATILKTDKIILLASGKKKAQAIRKTINCSISTKVPASFLQTHSEVVIILDKDSASLIDKNKLSADIELDIHY